MAYTVKKSVTPLRRGQEHIYPPTVLSQVKMDDDLTKTADQVMVRNDIDVLTLEEIQASTSLEGKVASAEAFKQLNDGIEDIKRLNFSNLTPYTDLNSIPTKQFAAYSIYSPLNAPIEGAWVTLIQIPIASVTSDFNYVYQLCFVMGMNNAWIREQTAGGWANWNQVCR